MKLKHIRPPRKSAIKRRWLWLTLLAVVWLVCSGQAFAAGAEAENGAIAPLIKVIATSSAFSL